MGKKVDIDAVIAEIESAIAENGVESNIDEWIAEAKSLAKTASIAELNQRCDAFVGVPMIIDWEYMPDCGCCPDADGTRKTTWLFAIENGNEYQIFIQCSFCKAVGSENMPLRICGRDRAVTTIAVYLREKVDRLFERAATRLEDNLNRELRG